VNPDASRWRAAHESVAIVGHAASAPAGCSGSAGRPRATSAAEPTLRIRRRSRFDRGRSACKRARAGRNARREKGELNRASSVATRPTSPRQARLGRATLTTHCACHGGGHGIRMDCYVLPGAVPGSLRRNRRPHSAAPTPHSRRGRLVHRIRAAERGTRAIDSRARRWKAWMRFTGPSLSQCCGLIHPFHRTAAEKGKKETTKNDRRLLHTPKHRIHAGLDRHPQRWANGRGGGPKRKEMSDHSLANHRTTVALAAGLSLLYGLPGCQHSHGGTTRGVSRASWLISPVSTSTYHLAPVGDGHHIWAWPWGMSSGAGVRVINDSGRVENASTPLLPGIAVTQLYPLGDGTHALALSGPQLGSRGGGMFIVGRSPKDSSSNLLPTGYLVSDVALGLDGAWVRLSRLAPDSRSRGSLVLFVSRHDLRTEPIAVESAIQAIIPLVGRRALLFADESFSRDPYGRGTRNDPYSGTYANPGRSDSKGYGSSGYDYGCYGDCGSDAWYPEPTNESYDPSSGRAYGYDAAATYGGVTFIEVRVPFHHTVSFTSRKTRKTLSARWTPAGDGRHFWSAFSDAPAVSYVDTGDLAHQITIQLIATNRPVEVRSGAVTAWAFESRYDFKQPTRRGAYFFNVSREGTSQIAVPIKSLADTVVDDIVPLVANAALVEIESRGSARLVLATSGGRIYDVAPDSFWQHLAPGLMRGGARVYRESRLPRFMVSMGNLIFHFDGTTRRIRVLSRTGADIIPERSGTWWIINRDLVDERRGVSLYDSAIASFANDRALFNDQRVIPNVATFGGTGKGIASAPVLGTQLIDWTRKELPLTIVLGKSELRLSAITTPISTTVAFDPNAGEPDARLRLDGWPYQSIGSGTVVRVEIGSKQPDEQLILRSVPLVTSQGEYLLNVTQRPRAGRVPLNVPERVRVTLTDAQGSQIAWEWEALRFVSPTSPFATPWARSIELIGSICLVILLLSRVSSEARRWAVVAVLLLGEGTGLLMASFKALDGWVLAWGSLGVLLAAGLGAALDPSVFRELDKSLPPRISRLLLMPLLSCPWVRRRIYHDYLARTSANLEAAREEVSEKYMVIGIHEVQSQRVERDATIEPAASLVGLLAAPEPSHVLIEAPGGRGKSALVRETVRRAIEACRRRDRSRIPIVCADRAPQPGESLLSRIKAALGNQGFSDGLLRQLLERGEFFLVIDALTESSITPQMLDEHNATFATKCPMLLAARPSDEFRSVIRQTSSWIVVEPRQLDDSNLRGFIHTYGGNEDGFDESLRNACRGAEGEYLPVLVRLALMAQGDNPKSISDVYRGAVRKLLGRNDSLVDQTAQLCLETYWEDGDRKLAFYNSTAPRKALLQILRAAGLMVPALGVRREDEPRTVRFFHDSIQTYFTALALSQRQWDVTVLARAAADQRYSDGRSDLVTGAGSELFQMCLCVFEPEETLIRLLSKETQNYARAFANAFSVEWVAEAAGYRSTVLGGIDVAGGAALSTVAESEDAGCDIKFIGALFARVALFLWPRICGVVAADGGR
jgi:hypothetical protein